MEFHVPIPDRIPWNLVSVELHRIPWKCFHAIPWNSMSQYQTEFHGKFSTEFHRVPWNSMGYFIVHSFILRGG